MPPTPPRLGRKGKPPTAGPPAQDQGKEVDPLLPPVLFHDRHDRWLRASPGAHQQSPGHSERGRPACDGQPKAGPDGKVSSTLAEARATMAVATGGSSRCA